MEEPVNRPVAIYIRVSTVDQAEEGYSLDAQERVLREWCRTNDRPVYKVYADRGISGKDIVHRPAMQEMLLDAKSGVFKTILFWALSRFTRSVGDLYKTIEQLSKYDIDLKSYTEPFETGSPVGRAMIGVSGVFAQLERELTGERVRAAMEERAQRGLNTAVYMTGYDRMDDGSFQINTQEAEYVRFLFDTYEDVKNLTLLAGMAKERGFRGKRNSIPTAWSVQRLLMSPRFCGFNLWHNRICPGEIPQIITPEQYGRVQDLLRAQGKRYGRHQIHFPSALCNDSATDDKHSDRRIPCHSATSR